MSLGGILVQLLLLDHTHRLRSAIVFATYALGVGLADPTGRSGLELPGPDPRLLALWQRFADERDQAAEIDWRVEHWRILNGTVLPFDTEEFRELEERIIADSGTFHPLPRMPAPTPPAWTALASWRMCRFRLR